ncbi:LuxR C-terminal-related transcriptional regulator [Nonomuraea antimicrobica]
MSRVARGLAVLGHNASTALLSEFLGVQPGVVEQALNRLGAIGVLDRTLFRHPAARSAVLEELDPGEREEAHGRAAALLHAQGVAAAVVAGHLLGAPGLRASFAPAVLHEAAGQALADDQHEFAIQCLKLAAELNVDGPRRTLARARLARAEWQLNPAAVARHIGPLTEATMNGEAGPNEMYTLFRFQLWDGRLDEAAEVFERLVKGADEAGHEDFAVQVDAAHHWLSHSYPSVLLRTGRNAAPPPRAKRAIHGLSLQAQAVTAMSAVLREDTSVDAVKTAERVLQSVTLDDSHLETVESALLALVYSDRTDRAVLWCDVLYHEATERRSPTWRALLAAFRSCIAIRQGDLMTAEEYAGIALTVLPPRSLGVVVALPLAVMLRATTEMGKYDAATRYLRMPLPDTAFQTRFGLHYLDARARYYLAADHPLAALKDFVTCGRLAREWDLDVPMLTPWRQGAAAALLQMGEPGQALQYVEQHSSLSSGHSLRTKGVSLRLRAAASDLRQRPSLLRESVEVLQTSGDHLEMAYALVDLARTLEELGESSRAQMIEHRAATVARSCGAEPLRSKLTGVSTGDAGGNGAEEADRGFISALSDAEQRVASLAALGYTNREIARKIFITVSTVEQHLTRIYRKLNVTGRKDLPSHLTQKAVC